MNSNELRSQLEFHIVFEGFLCFLKEEETKVFFEFKDSTVERVI